MTSEGQSPDSDHFGGGPKVARVIPYLVAATLIVELALAVIYLVLAWPPTQRGSTAAPDSMQAPIVTHVGLFSFTSDTDGLLITLVVAAGVLGSAIHGLTSISSYIGNERFLPRWTLWYLVRAPVGVALAMVIYFLLRGGLLNGQSASDVINPFAVAALSALAGMFSKQATDKLEEVFSTLFQTTDGGDADREDKLE